MEFFISNDLAILNPSNLTFSGPMDLPLYAVHEYQMCSALVAGKSGVKIYISFRRHLISNILTVFLPTIILIILSHMANSFEDDYLDMVISVNLTVLLVLATL